MELRGEQEQIAWLQRKGQQAGFTLLTVRAQTGVADLRSVGAGERVVGGRGTGQVTLGSLVFEGRLRVTDAALFARALEDGIGGGKAFGFGLSSVAPA